MKKINIILPSFRLNQQIAGGYKVLYQYSNYLVNNGYDVKIYYNLLNGYNSKHVPKFIVKFIKKICFFIKKSNYPKWFKLDKKVKQKVCNINNKTIRNADITIATAYTTVEYIKKLSIEKGKIIYFIQDYEKWDNTTDKQLYDSYNLGWTNIAVSNWLKEIVENHSNSKCYLIPNGVDSNVFNVKIPIENRDNFSIAYLYHNDERKGCKYGIDILKKLKLRYPNLTVNMFGSPNKPDDLPEYINYTKNASEYEVSNILNNSAIYMCTSIEEGFGLPGLEAMMCGCALVSTKTKGVMEYTKDDNALISEINDFEMIYNNICKLIDNETLRINIAREGNKYVCSKNINSSALKFKNVLDKINKK